MVQLPELPADDAFPQLALVMDPEPMREVFQRALPDYSEGGFQIDSVKIERFQYKPGQRCRICYAVKVRVGALEERYRHLLYGVLDSRGRASGESARGPAGDRESGPGLTPPLHYLAELEMALWRFPADPRLEHLAELVDRESVLGLVERHAAALGLAPGRPLRTLDTRIAKWVPGSRCVLEHRLWDAEAREDAEPALHLYSKTYRAPRAAPVFRIMQQLWGSAGRREGALQMPEPLLLVPELETIFQRPVSGQSAVDRLDELDLPRLTPQLGGLLASIHQSQLDGLDLVPPDEELDDVQKARKIIRQSVPELAETVDRIAAALRQRLPETTGLAATPVHGAFRLSQMLLADGRLALLDFDGLRRGNPLSDVGSLVAHLLYQAVKQKLPLAGSRDAVASFCRAYAARAPWGVPDGALRWYTAASLVGKHGKKIIKRAKKRRDESLAQLLCLAEAVLAGVEPLA